jgi:hypothetical protein
MGTKISLLPSAIGLTDADVLPGVQSAADVKVTALQIKTYVIAALATVATSGNASDLTGGTLAAARLPALSGDISTSAGSAVTAIGTNKVTRGMLAQAGGATLLGATAAGNVADLTAAQAKTFLAIGAADVTDKAVNSIAATSYTFALSDIPLWARFTAGTAINATIPPNSSVAFPIGTVLEGSTAGTGVLTFVAGGGVTLNSRGGAVTAAGQFSPWMLKKTATDTWLLMGDIA